MHESPIGESVEALGVFLHIDPFPGFRLRHNWDVFDLTRDEEVQDPFRLYNNQWERVWSIDQSRWDERGIVGFFGDPSMRVQMYEGPNAHLISAQFFVAALLFSRGSATFSDRSATF